MPTVFVTVPPDAAEEMASRLIEERLAACVNRVPCASTYRWNGHVQEDEETILLIKTTSERYERLRDRVLEIHPYDVPCIERFDEDDLNEAFADWRASASTPN